MALVDNNVLSSLAKIDRLDLLPSVFETVETPPSVIGELDRADPYSAPLYHGRPIFPLAISLNLEELYPALR
jgi:predicted nucleic acid-binding protein